MLKANDLLYHLSAQRTAARALAVAFQYQLSETERLLQMYESVPESHPLSALAEYPSARLREMKGEIEEDISVCTGIAK